MGGNGPTAAGESRQASPEWKERFARARSKSLERGIMIKDLPRLIGKYYARLAVRSIEKALKGQRPARESAALLEAIAKVWAEKEGAVSDQAVIDKNLRELWGDGRDSPFHANQQKTSSERVFGFKLQNRHLLARAGKHYYRSVDETPDFPLIAKSKWVPSELRPLDTVKCEWLGRIADDVPPLRLPLFGGLTCEEWSKKMKPEMKVGPGFCYRLRHVDASAGRFKMQFQASDYRAFYNTCEALAFETAEWCINKDRLPDPASNDLPSHGSPNRIFDLSIRNAVPAQNAILILFNGVNGNHFLLHDRSTSQYVAELQNTYHVVPAGTFEPDGYADSHHDRDFSLRRAILRELAEELLGKSDHLQGFVATDDDFLSEPAMQPFLKGEREGSLRLFFLGLGIDPVSVKPQISLCIAIDARALGLTEYRSAFTDNWEGKYFVVPWSKENLIEFSRDPKMASPGAACLALALRHFDQLSALYTS
jgi:hypothetical protein